MKYTVNTETKTINIESQMSSKELKGLCEQYPDYSFCGNSYNVLYYKPNPFFNDGLITYCGTTSTNIFPNNGTCTIADGIYSAGTTLTNN